MKAGLGALLALACLVAGGAVYGWQGVVFALTAILMLLLVQFTKLMRVMGRASRAPIGRRGNALVVEVRLKADMPLVDVLTLTGSLGEAVPNQAHAYTWTDEGGDRLTLQFSPNSRLQSWQLQRAS